MTSTRINLKVAALLIGTAIVVGCGDSPPANGNPDAQVAMDTSVARDTATPGRDAIADARRDARVLPACSPLNLRFIDPAFTPRCSATTLAMVNACTTAACLQSALTADSTPTATPDGGTPISCNTCFFTQQSACAYANGCSTQFDDLGCCVNTECGREATQAAFNECVRRVSGAGGECVAYGDALDACAARINANICRPSIDLCFNGPPPVDGGVAPADAAAPPSDANAPADASAPVDAVSTPADAPTAVVDSATAPDAGTPPA